MTMTVTMAIVVAMAMTMAMAMVVAMRQWFWYETCSGGVWRRAYGCGCMDVTQQGKPTCTENKRTSKTKCTTFFPEARPLGQNWTHSA